MKALGHSGWLFVMAALGMLAGCPGPQSSPDALPGDAAGERSDDAAGDAPPADVTRADVTPPFDGGPVGPACVRDQDCTAAGTVCRADTAATAQDLASMALGCGVVNPTGAALGARCNANADCDRGLCAFAGTCVRPCAADADCGAGQFCTQVYTQTGPAAMQPLQACVARLDLPPGVTASPRQQRALGFDDLYDPLQLPGIAPPATSSLTLIEVNGGPAPTAEALVTRDLNATELFSIAGLFGPDALTPLNPVVATHFAFGALIPNGPDSILTPDGYDLLLNFREPTDVALTTLTRATRGTVLDVNLFYVGVQGLMPTGDRGPPRISAALDAVAQVYRAANITLGEVRQFRMVGALAGQFTSIDERPPGTPSTTPTEEEDLFRMSAGAGRPCVNFFFVRALGMSLGRAGGIPGMQAAHGTGGSGIVLLYNLPAGETLGYVMAHELGHFLGLFHTSEVPGVVIEPLTDTPECRRVQDADGDGYVSPAECTGHGADNLMFWAGPSGATPTFSPQQQAVVGRAMVLH